MENMGGTIKQQGTAQENILIYYFSIAFTHTYVRLMWSGAFN